MWRSVISKSSLFCVCWVFLRIILRHSMQVSCHQVIACGCHLSWMTDKGRCCKAFYSVEKPCICLYFPFCKSVSVHLSTITEKSSCHFNFTHQTIGVPADRFVCISLHHWNTSWSLEVWGPNEMHWINQIWKLWFCFMTMFCFVFFQWKKRLWYCCRQCQLTSKWSISRINC